MAQQQPQPIFILPEGYQRTIGRDAQRTNILAAKLVAETVRTTLGPKGMDKMIVDSLGDVTITNDGVTILQEMQIEHPAAKMLVEVAKTQEDEVGDGTTTVVVLAGELLKNAERLLEQEVHPTVIARGYHIASEKAMEILNEMAEPVKPENKDVLKKIAMTAMTGKGAESHKELLADLTVKAVQQVADGKTIDIRDIKIEKKVGDSVDESELIQGVVLDKERVHSGMPKRVENARIAILDVAVEIKSTETDAKIQISDPSQMGAFLEQEAKMIRDMVEELRPLATEKNLDLSFTTELREISVNADAPKLKQVFQNLVDNAIKYTPQGFVRVKVKDEHQKGTVLVVVSDSGLGIAEALIPFLFDEFVRDDRVKKEIRGTGLGLFIARKIIEAHGGTVWAQSEGENKGSKFFIRMKKLA